MTYKSRKKFAFPQTFSRFMLYNIFNQNGTPTL